MTPNEWGRLQGFIGYAFVDENGVDHFSFPEDTTDGQKYKQFGNSVSIPVIETMAEFMLECFSTLEVQQVEVVQALADNNLFFTKRDVMEMLDINAVQAGFLIRKMVLANELKRIFQFWLGDHNVDGFRLDAVTSYFTSSKDKNLEFMTWLNNECKAINDDCYLVGEGSWSGNSSENRTYQDSGVDSFFNFMNQSAACPNNGRPLLMESPRISSEIMTRSAWLVQPEVEATPLPRSSGIPFWASSLELSLIIMGTRLGNPFQLTATKTQTRGFMSNGAIPMSRTIRQDHAPTIRKQPTLTEPSKHSSLIPIPSSPMSKRSIS